MHASVRAVTSHHPDIVLSDGKLHPTASQREQERHTAFVTRHIQRGTEIEAKRNQAAEQGARARAISK